jgi:hypothetical protein
MVKTYIHTNNRKPVTSKPLSLLLVTFPEFKNNSPNWENNYSMSGSSLNWKNNYSASGFVSNNSPFNFLAKLTSLKSPLMLFSSISSHCESEQHLDSNTIFSPLFSLSTSFTHPHKIDSPDSDSEFEDLLLHFTYGFSFPPLTNLFLPYYR